RTSHEGAARTAEGYLSAPLRVDLHVGKGLAGHGRSRQGEGPEVLPAPATPLPGYAHRARHILPRRSLPQPARIQTLHARIGDLRRAGLLTDRRLGGEGLASRIILPHRWDGPRGRKPATLETAISWRCLVCHTIQGSMHHSRPPAGNRHLSSS